MSNETDLIATYFAPLSLGSPSAYGLKDDAAHLPISYNGHVITLDQVIEGTHFLSSDPLDKVAKKLLRRNLSDLIGKGAKPVAAFLSLAWPKSRPQAEIAKFAKGLGEDLATLCDHCPLLGGDTSTIDGPLVASLTLIGAPPADKTGPVLRSGAQVGDGLYVTGKIGFAWLGLQARLGHRPHHGLEATIEESLLPNPPSLSFAAVVGEFARAAIDVSDGLLADLDQLLSASDMSLKDYSLNLDAMEASGLFPHPIEGKAWSIDDILGFVTGGDDYQTLCAVRAESCLAFETKCDAIGVHATRISTIVARHSAGEFDLIWQGKRVARPARLGWSV